MPSIRLVDINGYELVVLRPQTPKGTDPIACTEFNIGWPGHRESMFERPGRSGSIDMTMLHGPREVTFELKLMDAGTYTKENMLDLLYRISAPGNRFYVYARRDGWAQERRMLVRTNNLSCNSTRQTASFFSVSLSYTCASGTMEGAFDNIDLINPPTAHAGVSFPLFWTADPNGFIGSPSDVTQTYKGYWNSTVSYIIGNVVFYKEKYYTAVAPSKNVKPGTNAAVWAPREIGPVYDPARSYKEGDTMYYNGRYYTAVADSLGQDPTDINFWRATSTGFDSGTSLNTTIIFYEGNQSGPLKFEITGQCDNPRITNATTSRWMYFKNMTILPSQTLTIDTEEGTAQIGSQSYYSKIDFDRGSNWFGLVPGENVIKFEADNVDANCQLIIHSTPRWI